MSRAAIHADLLADFHNRLGIVPDYEHVLECGYRGLIDSGDTVVDVGAHTGRHTSVFAELVGPEGLVLAFEPLPDARDMLEARGLGPQVRLLPFALADVPGRAPFIHARGTPEESGLRRKNYNRPDLVHPEEIEVDIRRLDDFLADFRGLAFVKIDVEGAEIACIKGARAALDRFRPFVTVEYGRPSYSAYGNEARTLFDLAKSFGYVIGDLFGAVCRDVAEWGLVCDVAYWDWFLVPQERVDEWRARLSSRRSVKETEAVTHETKIASAEELALEIATAKELEIASLRAEIVALGTETAALRGSTSWRVTAPMRALVRVFRNQSERRMRSGGMPVADF